MITVHVKIPRMGKATVFQDAAFEALAREVSKADDLFKGTYGNWRDKPRFTAAYGMGKGPMGIGKTGEMYGEIYTRNLKYIYINYGVEERVIHARNHSHLVFQETRPSHSGSWIPKTTPGSLKSGPSSRSGPRVAIKSVLHSVAARRFDLAVAKSREKFLNRTMFERIQQAVRRFWR
jgi:hypothetical protein